MVFVMFAIVALAAAADADDYQKAACAATPAGTEEYEIVTAAAGCEAKCPDDYSLVSCESDPQNSGSGVQITATSCKAGIATAKTIATCSTGVSSTLEQSGSATGKGELKASCPAGTGALWCYCHSANKRCFQSAFEPVGNACAQTVSDRSDVTVSVLCSGIPDYRVVLIDAEAKLNTSAVFCASDMFLLEPSNGENTCVKDCPPGYINSKDEDAGYGICTVCKGSSARRRTEVCNKCSPGTVPMANSNDCRNMQDMCDEDECTNCKACLTATQLELTGCTVSSSSCYNPTENGCEQNAQEVYACKGKGLGCWYKKMCKSACVCEEWKKVFCGEKYPAGTTDDPLEECDTSFMLLLQGASVPEKDRNASFMALHQERMEVARTASLDESLSGKRC